MLACCWRLECQGTLVVRTDALTAFCCQCWLLTWSAGKLKAHELRGKGKADLLKQLDSLKSELAVVRTWGVVSCRRHLQAVSRASVVVSAARRLTLYAVRVSPQLRVAKVTGGAASKLAKIKVVRKDIARVLTVYNQKTKAAVRAHNTLHPSAAGCDSFSVLPLRVLLLLLLLLLVW